MVTALFRVFSRFNFGSSTWMENHKKITTADFYFLQAKRTPALVEAENALTCKEEATVKWHFKRPFSNAN